MCLSESGEGVRERESGEGVCVREREWEGCVFWRESGLCVREKERVGRGFVCVKERKRELGGCV